MQPADIKFVRPRAIAWTHSELSGWGEGRRASVTIVAGEMAAAGIVENRRGNVHVIDRLGLESVACECYDHVNGELIRLMGYGPSQAPVL